MTPNERYASWLSGYFFVDGMDRDDLRQEALVAMFLARPGCERVAARRRILDLIRASQRRPRFAELVDAPDTTDVVDIVAARAVLRSIVEADLAANEHVAIGRTFRGQPIRRHEKALGVALWRARRKLAAPS